MNENGVEKSETEFIEIIARFGSCLEIYEKRIKAVQEKVLSIKSFLGEAKNKEQKPNVENTTVVNSLYSQIGKFEELNGDLLDVKDWLENLI